MSTPSDRPLARPTSALARPLQVDDVPDDGLVMAIEADPTECQAIADEIGIPAIGALSAKLAVKRLHGGLVQVSGPLKARITQICVVSLEPFESEIAQSVDIMFAEVRPPLPERHARQRNSRDALKREAESYKAPPPIQVTEGDADPPDPIVNGRIDPGAIAVEFLTLALDFYPKKPGVHFSDVEIGDSDEPKSAFAALERFKDRS